MRYTLAVVLLASAVLQGQSALDLLSDPATLPRFRPYVKVGSFSSYDRTGNNDDGFSGQYSFLRKEGDALVIAELNGPGVITRIWTPTPTGDAVEFFLDGDTEPRLSVPFRNLFDGTREPFVKPLVGIGGGGYWSYVPIEFSRSCKIRFRGPRLQFYQINYALYPPGTAVRTGFPSRAEVEGVARRWDDIAQPAGVRQRTTHTLQPGATAIIYQAGRGGRIEAIRLSPASAFAGPDRAFVLRATWDGAASPAILAPVGDFFGFSFGQPAAESLLLGTKDDVAYSYFPMPFDRSARIEIVSEAKTPVSFTAEVIASATARRPGEGRFHAEWRRENPTTPGAPFTMAEAAVRGHLVAAALQAQGLETGGTPFFEGDDQATLDGELTAHGTGSEDFFNGGWYDVPGRWDGRVNMPLSGALDYSKGYGRTGGYRLLLSDAYAFARSLKLTIEHGPEKNNVPTDYASTAYLYLEGDAKHPPLAANRRVIAPDPLVYVPGYSQPLFAFSMRNMTLERGDEKIDGKGARRLAIEAHGEENFGPHYVAPVVNVPESGEYDILLEAITGPANGSVQMTVNDVPVGERLSFTAPERRIAPLRKLATVTLRAGDNPVYLRLLPPEGAARDAKFRADLMQIVCKRVRR